jgi:hypothetical protein
MYCWQVLASKWSGCTVSSIIVLHILQYILLTVITCNVVRLDSWLLLYNGINNNVLDHWDTFVEFMDKIKSLSRNVTTTDYNGRLTNKMTNSSEMSLCKNQQAVSVYTQINETKFFHNSVLCLHTTTCNQLSTTIQVSVYPHLLVTKNCRHISCSCAVGFQLLYFSGMFQCRSV